MYFYRASGLSICSDEKIPGFLSLTSHALPELSIDFTSSLFPANGQETCCYSSSHVDEDGAPSLQVFRSADSGYRFRYADGTEFFLDAAGTRVTVRRPAGFSVAYATTYLVGPVLAFVLRLRGVVSLHASAIAIDDGAIALAGAPGAGKSTAAAAFAQAGYKVLSDDLVALSEDGGTFSAHPGHSHLRLWPASAALLYGTGHQLPPICEGWEKLDVDLRDRFQPALLPLRAVYILERDSSTDAPKIWRIEAGEAVIALISNTYAAYLLDERMRALELHVVSRLVRQVAVWKLAPGRARPGEIAAAVRSHRAEVGAPGAPVSLPSLRPHAL